MTFLTVNREMPLPEQLAFCGLAVFLAGAGVLLMVVAYRVWKGEL